MELKLEVVLSSSIKRKKPWPRFCWLGQEKEAVFLLDDKRISEINMVTGRTKKKTPKLPETLLNSVVTMAASQTGVWLAGLLVSGELFLWNRDKDWLKTASAVPEVAHLIASLKGHASRVSLQVSGDGMRAVLAVVTGHVYLWECADAGDLAGGRDGAVRGRWAHVQPSEDAALPSLQDKEASQHGIFVTNEAVGDVFLSAWVFTSGDKLSITFLRVRWEEVLAREVGCVEYSVKWATKTYPMSSLTPPCKPVRSRGALVPALSPDGRLLAVALNQKDPRATQVLFVSIQNFVSIARVLGGCGSKNLTIPSKYLRSYWVGSVSWSPTGLFLACVLKRGSLLMLARLGGLLSLSSSGCNVDFGPAHFLPLHPLVTYRRPESSRRAEASLSSSSASLWDVLRQRFSVTWHPRLFYLIVSDGYMATVLRLLDKASPALLMTALLREAGKDMESVVQRLEKSQVNIRAWLDSVSSLSSQKEETDPFGTSGLHTSQSQTTSPAHASPALPVFLQDQGTMSDTRELLHKAQAFFEDDSDVDIHAAGAHAEDGGVLEFASMFDTLHARSDRGAAGPLSPDPDDDPKATWDSLSAAGSERKPSRSSRALGGIKAGLLTAWALGLSLGGVEAQEQRQHLLTHTLRCVLRLAALLHYTTSGAAGGSRVPELFGAFLVFLSWDALHGGGGGGPSCLGPVVELTLQLARLLLSPLPDASPAGRSGSRVSSRGLAAAVRLVKQASEGLDHAYTLQRRQVWVAAPPGCGADTPGELWASDAHDVPLLQDVSQGGVARPGRSPAGPQRPSSRLHGAWRWLYDLARRYTEELEGYAGRGGWAEERERASVVLSQVQEGLQGAGLRLEDGHALLSCEGERHFLFGLYAESADVWRSEMWAERNISSERSVFQETRLSLAMLYGLLFQYRLREAQALGDHMARLLLDHAAPSPPGKDPTEGEAQCERWLPADLHPDAARAAVQSLGRFMASYFTNQPLSILPPHSVELLPPLHLPHAPSARRLVPLCQERVARAVREQQVSDVWTVDYAQDLLLVGGLLPEAVWLAQRLGDWKTAASLSLAYSSHRDQRFPGVRLRELHLPAALETGSILQDQLHSLLGRSAGSNETEGARSPESSEGEPWDELRGSVQEVLRASAMAGADVVSGPLCELTESARALSSCLPALVPRGLYLPAPPLYCPQPASNSQDPVGSLGQLSEVSSRRRVSAALQKLLLLLRSARCCRPAAQWYVSQLRRARHVQYKIKKKYGHPRAAEEERSFPEGLAKLDTRGGFFRKGPNKDGQLDPVTIQTLSCFRDLCALCWLLHVRDQLSLSCRKYQAARQTQRDTQECDDSEMSSACVEAVHWACRLLPFSRFLNAEEILQDVLLSLVSELPPLSMVADTVVRAFPEEEDSVRVPLREKYHSLLERLKHCTLLGDTEESGETMMVALQDRRRQRRKDLRRLQRHLAPPQLFLWEREEAEENRGAGGAGAGAGGGGGGGGQGVALPGCPSLGPSVSDSTLTDRGQPMVYSDGDTAENTSDALLTDPPSRTNASKQVQDPVKAKKAPSKSNNKVPRGRPAGGPPPRCDPDGPALPAVGAWEFELEDEEYPRFLELFLSYVLEKDHPESQGGEEEGCELPLLRGFTPVLRQRELHSLAFDVLSAMGRRQRDHAGRRQATATAAGPDHHAPVFRAGRSFRPVAVPELAGSEPRSSLVWSQTPEEPAARRTQLSGGPAPGLRPGSQLGLFGLMQQQQQQQRTTPAPESSTTGGSSVRSVPSPGPSAVPWGSLSEGFAFGAPVSTETLADLRHGLDAQLEARFPELGRLLEWMVRWANRRTALGTRGAGRSGPGDGGGGGVVIRVKASTPAVLTALSLLEQRCSPAGPVWTPRVTSAPVPPPPPPPEAGWSQEGEGSVDTGYPGSAHTPVTLPDPHLHAEEPVSGWEEEEEEEEEPERGAPGDTVDPVVATETVTTCDSEMGTLTPLNPSLCDPSLCDPSLCEPSPCDHAAAEEDEPSSASEDTSALSVLSVDKVHAPDTVLKLEDLRCSERVDQASNATSHGISTAGPDAPSEPEPPTGPTVKEAQGGIEAPGPSVRAAPLIHNAQDDPAHLQPSESPQATAPPPVATVTNDSPAPQAEPVRQLVNDELFRLVQLQQINFMSLMHMVGSSLASLPYMQHAALLAQSTAPLSHPPAARPAPFPPPQPDAAFPPVHADPSEWLRTGAAVPPFLASAYRPSDPLPGQPPASRDQPATVDGAESIQPPSVWAAPPPPPPPRSPPAESPAPRGPLTPADLDGPLPAIPLPQPPDPDPPRHAPPSPVLPGLKLLRLPPSTPEAPVRQAWGPPPQHTHPPHPDPHARDYGQAVSFRTHQEEEDQEEEEDEADVEVSFAPPARHGLRSASGSARRRSRASGPYSGTPRRGAEFPSFPHRPPPGPGLRLLSCRPPSAPGPAAFPQVSLLTAAGRPPPPTIQLLQVDPDPGMVFPPSTPAPEVNYTGLLQDLRRLDPGRTGAGPSGLQLIMVDPPPENQGGAALTRDITPSSRKTRSRRDRGNTGDKVTFRPDESIIPAHEPNDERVTDEPARRRDLAIPFDLPDDPLLMGQRLLDKAYATSAELHAFASTRKNPPESQDACTNTDPAGPSKLVDKAVSAIAANPESQSPAAGSPPEVLMDRWLPREAPVRDTEETQQRPQQNQDAPGRRFLNVVDLEEEPPLLRDPPPGSGPAQRPAPPPSSAQLHLTAASVVCGALATEATASPAASPRTSPTASPTAQGEIAETVTPPDRPAAASTGDPVTDAVLRGRPGAPHSGMAPGPRSPGPPGASPGPQAAHFSSCLSEMDAQLAALQSIADHMETEFVNSRMLVQTIDTLTPLSEAPGPERRTPRSKTVSLFIPDKAWRPPADANKENVSEGRRRGTRDPQTDPSFAKRRSLSLSPLSPNAQAAAPPGPRTPTRMTGRAFPETTGMSVDSSLGLSGLSDMTDILGELVREGALSPSDLDVSHTQAARLHRLQDQQQQQQQQQQYQRRLADRSLQSRAADDRDSRKELRTWMRRKQRERLASYQRQREEMRQREKRPFASGKALNSTFTYQAAVKKIKEDKDKAMLLEQYNQRTREACALISDLPQSTLTVPSAAWTGSALSPSSVHSPTAHIPAGSKTRDSSSKVQSRPSQLLFDPWEQSEKQRWRSPLENQQRFGLHRPVSTLPKDRLSQVTRRGMISEAKGRATPHGPANQGRVPCGPANQGRAPHGPANQGNVPHREGPLLSGMNRSPSRATSAGRRDRREEMEMEEIEREEMEASSSWNPPQEISSLLDTKEPKTSVAVLSEDDDEEEEGAAAMSWLEKLSDSDTSNLSRIDWAEIERLVATEEI